ncbi:MAG: rhodanese-like domain-containing protein [Coriobacteriia bacterium]|nr:rhodanese-like domain-containing protein [Coriobacteriia bacterium]
MKPKTMVWIVVGVIAAVIVGWNLFRPAAGGIENVDAQEAKAVIAKGAQIVDVRTPGEFQLGRIAGSINVPLDQLEQQAASWDRNATYLVYCATGDRSVSAVDIMRALGFTSIAHLSAGVASWPDPLETGDAAEGADSQRIATSGKPVMVEFFTDS